jgi:glycosyltransferase involved in cell wall biosynthesis
MVLGHLDIMVGHQLLGWAWMPAMPTKKPTVYFFVNRFLVGKSSASKFRPDLLTAGIGDGRHGFAFNIDSSVEVNPGDLIEAIIFSDYKIWKLTCGPSFEIRQKKEIIGDYKVTHDGLVHGWVTVSNDPVQLAIELNGEVVSNIVATPQEPRRVATNTCCYRVSFQHLINKKLLRNQKTLIRVIVCETQEALSPGTVEFRYEGSYVQMQDLQAAHRLKIRAELFQSLGGGARPYISVLLPTFNSDIAYLKSAIDSVRGQSYSNWQLCIADDASTTIEARRLICNYAAGDPRISVVIREHNGHISCASNSALNMANGSFTALLDHDDFLDEDALLYVAQAIKKNPSAKIIFSNEDKCDTSGQRYSPYSKQGWDPELILGQNCVSHFGVFSTSLLKSLGGFRREYDGAQDYDLVLRASLHTPSAEIIHIPEYLYHWRAVPGSTALAGNEKAYAAIAMRKALREYLNTKKLRGRIYTDTNTNHLRYRPEIRLNNKLVSIVIHYNGHPGSLSTLLQSIKPCKKFDVEIVIIDTSSTKKIRKSFAKIHPARSRFIKLPRDTLDFKVFEHSLDKVSGEVMIWINAAIIPCKKKPGWLQELVSQSLREEVGVVGPKIVDSASNVISFGKSRAYDGVIVSDFVGLSADSYGPAGIARLNRKVTAVSSHVFSARTTTIRAVAGMPVSEAQTVDDWAANLCMRAERLGLRNIVTASCHFLCM